MKQTVASKMNKEKRQQFTSFLCSKQQKKKLEELIKEAFQHDQEYQSQSGDLFFPTQRFDPPPPSFAQLVKSSSFPSYLVSEPNGQRVQDTTAQPLTTATDHSLGDGQARGGMPVLRLKKPAPNRQALPSLTELDGGLETSVIPFKRKIRSEPTFCTSSSIPIPLPDAPWRTTPDAQSKKEDESQQLSSSAASSSTGENMQILDCFIDQRLATSSPLTMHAEEPSPTTSSLAAAVSTSRFGPANKIGATPLHPELTPKRLAITSGQEQCQTTTTSKAESSIELNSNTYNKLNEILRLFQLNKSSDEQLSPPSSLMDYAPPKYQAAAGAASSSANDDRKDSKKIIFTDQFFESMNEKDYHLSNDTNKTMNALQKLLAQAFATTTKQPWSKKVSKQTTGKLVDTGRDDSPRVVEIGTSLDNKTGHVEPNASASTSSVVSKKFNFYPTFAANRFKATDAADAPLTTSDLIGASSKLPYAIPLPYKATTLTPAFDLGSIPSPMIPSPSTSSDWSMSDMPESPGSKTAVKGTLVNAGVGRGKHVCTECGIRARKPSLLKKHMITHANLRPFICCYCNIGFKTKGNLVKHMKTQNHVNKCISLGMNTEDDAIRMITSENVDNQLLEEQAKINNSETSEPSTSSQAKPADDAAAVADPQEPPEQQIDFLTTLLPGDEGLLVQEDKAKSSQDYQNTLFQSIFDDFLLDNNCIS